MRAIVIMYDSLNRGYLPNYGDETTAAPNFRRLGERAAAFDNFHAGSLPCMPARREMHTGRHNFLHRSWGPLEPFDRSMPQMLSDAGVYTHCVTDHAHYWQDGGEAYLNRFSSCEMIRGQEGDFWRGRAEGFTRNTDARRQDAINRLYMTAEEEHPHARTNAAALRFLEDNADSDNWFLQIEHFDPHEPFFAPRRFRDMYGSPSPANDWPEYGPAGDAATVDEVRRNYRALVSMCDEYLGRILDFMDSRGMWKDTLLIVNTDHGFLLGEHGYFAKNLMPAYDELEHTPFFAWDPRAPHCAGARRSALTQTIDIAPTLLEYFGAEPPREMLGLSLRETIAADAAVREHALFGYFGKHVNVTDGRHVYMRAGRTSERGALNEYTVMPQHLFTPFSVEELRGAERTLTDRFSFTRGVPVMRIPVNGASAPKNSAYMYEEHAKFGDILFDLRNDPGQTSPVRDAALEERMIRALRALLRENEAPDELYRRIGL